LPVHPDPFAPFEAALRGGPLPPGLTARDPAEVPRRFAVYRNNVTVSLTGALSLRFPVVRRLVGDEYFTALAGVYAEADRPKSPVLAEWGEGFAGFLAAFPPLAAYPYLPDVARIEQARGRAFHAADAPPVDPAILTAVDPDAVRLILHPSVILLRLSHPAVSIWAHNQPGAEARPVGAGPDTALILRDAAFAVPVLALGAGDAAFVEAMLRGSVLAEAARWAQGCEPGHDPQPILVTLMRAGAIIDAKV
jgi:hypothetical protein